MSLANPTKPEKPEQNEEMTLQEIIETLDLKVLTAPQNFSSVHVSQGYTSDLLSCVMAGAQHGGLWVTLQAHINIVAVAALLELAAVIITENATPDANTLAKANQEGVVLLSTDKPTFYVVGKLWEKGIGDQ
jgi:predicted transcriptional regulator